MDTALPQKFPFILDRNLAKANCTENRVCTSCDIVVLLTWLQLGCSQFLDLYVAFLLYMYSVFILFMFFFFVFLSMPNSVNPLPVLYIFLKKVVAWFLFKYKKAPIDVFHFILFFIFGAPLTHYCLKPFSRHI